MTLLEQVAQAIGKHMPRQPDNAWGDRNRDAAIDALKAILTPTVAMASRGGLQAFAGPQVEGEPLRVYPALIWREMLSYIIDERDREPVAEPEGEEASDG